MNCMSFWGLNVFINRYDKGYGRIDLGKRGRLVNCYRAAKTSIVKEVVETCGFLSKSGFLGNDLERCGLLPGYFNYMVPSQISDFAEKFYAQCQPRLYVVHVMRGYNDTQDRRGHAGESDECDVRSIRRVAEIEDDTFSLARHGVCKHVGNGETGLMLEIDLGRPVKSIWYREKEKVYDWIGPGGVKVKMSHFH